MARRATLGLRPFLDELERRLLAIGPDGLLNILLDHAEDLPAGQRAAFLEVFPSPGRAGSVVAVVPAMDGEALLADIDAFIEAVQAGTYFEGWGWDHEVHEERAFGDESWVTEMDSLFDAAAAAFVDGDLELARDAYAKLIQGFSLDEDVGTFCGDRPATEMVETDLAEAKARYLRALYETVPVAERAGRLVDALDELDHLGPPVSLGAVADTRREPLPDLDIFLPAWIERLTVVPQGGYGLARSARRFLAEASALHRGSAGLADLARRPGPDQADAYLDWVDHLERDGEATEALAAAREGMAAVGPAGEGRAFIADRLADLAGGQGDVALVLEARRQAWRASASVTRLLSLARACPDESLSAVLDEEAAMLHRPSARQGDKRASPDGGRPSCALLLAAGHLSDATALLREMVPHGWSSPEDPGTLVIAYLLLAASGQGTPPTESGSLLAELFAGVDTPDWASGPDQRSSRGQVASGERGEPTLAELLVRSIQRLAPSPAERCRLLEQAHAVIEARIAAIVDAQHRGAYRRAAGLAVACAEAAALGTGAEAGDSLVATWHARYPRHSAFRTELRLAAAASPFLRTPARPR